VKKTPAKRGTAKTPRKAVPNPTEQPKLHSGGNLQIAKGYGEAPVQAYVGGDGWIVSTALGYRSWPLTGG
jgi:hypothetical protein